MDASSKDSRSDAELCKAALAGGPEDFTPIVRRYQDAVFAVALARLRNFHDAQDVAQHVLLEAFQRLDGLADHARLGAWLRSITIHHCIDLIRARHQSTPLDAAPPPQAHASPPLDSMEHRELREQVLEAIGRLTRPQRETATLFYINGYSVEQVAAMQEAPVGTVKRRLHDARQRLKEEMVHVVEDVLKSESPKEDFAQQVFDILCQYRAAGSGPYRRLRWRQTVEELRRIGNRGLEGFLRALESRHSPTRVFAMHMLEHHNAPQDAETIIQVLKKGLGDPNRKVRRHAVEALLDSDQPDDRKRHEFVPLVLPLLADPSNRVRRCAGWSLVHWWQHVPLEAAAKALLNETDGESRKRLKGLVHAIANRGQRKWYSS